MDGERGGGEDESEFLESSHGLAFQLEVTAVSGRILGLLRTFSTR
jgi:hypothetical protein